jgi:hypothetical protein
MWISLRFDPHLPPMPALESPASTDANTPATLQSTPPESTAEAAPESNSEPSRPESK